MLKGFPKLLKFVRINKFYIPGGNPYLVLHDHKKSSLFTTFMNKEDSIKCHQFVIRYGRLVLEYSYLKKKRDREVHLDNEHLSILL